jgi:hypothetical protein
MAWTRSSLPLPNNQIVQLVAATNRNGLIELFAADANGNLWHAAQQIGQITIPVPPFTLHGPNREATINFATWGNPDTMWTQLGNPQPFQGQSFQFAVATAAYGGLSVFVASLNSVSTWSIFQGFSDLTQWSAWEPMASLPSPIAPFDTGVMCIAAETAGEYGVIVVCYVSDQKVLYNFQNGSTPGWNVAAGSVLNLDLPAPAPQFGPLNLSITSGLGGLTLLVGATAAGGIGFFATTLPAWNPPGNPPWPPLTALGVYTNGIPDGGVLIPYNGNDVSAYFCDNTKALYSAWQQPTTGAWVPYDKILISGYCRYEPNGSLAICENALADQGSAATHQLLLFLDPTGTILNSIQFTGPRTFGPVVPIDSSAAFGVIDALSVTATPVTGINLFGLGMETHQTQLFYWTQSPSFF